MNMKTFATLAWLLAFLAPALAGAQTPSPAPAGDPSGKTYVTARLGVIIPQHSDLDGMDNGLSIEGAFGYRLNPNFALELGLGRWSMSGQSSVSDPSFGTASVKLEFVGYPVFLTAKGILPLDNLEVYGLVGAGIHFISATGDVSLPSLGLSASTTDSTSAFGLHFGGGLDFHVSPTTSLGAELKYIIGEATLFGATGHFDSLIIAAALRYTP